MRRDEGFTLIELLVVVAIISLIAAIATPGLLRARITANETSAIASLRTTAVAQVSYASACGGGSYATSYTVLGTPLVTGGEAFISADLGVGVTPQKTGFNFTLEAGNSTSSSHDCKGRPTNGGYYATATPQAFRVSGNRSFAVDKFSTLWQSQSATPPAQPFTVTSTESTLR